jgi:hypothetical protein
VLEVLSTAKRARNLALRILASPFVQYRGGAVCHGGLRDAADRRHRDVDLVDPRHAECGAAREKS